MNPDKIVTIPTILHRLHLETYISRLLGIILIALSFSNNELT